MHDRLSDLSITSLEICTSSGLFSNNLGVAPLIDIEGVFFLNFGLYEPGPGYLYIVDWLLGYL